MPGGDKPTLYLIAGPNGAGKSSLYASRIAKITNAAFINADDIEREWRESGQEPQPYAASKEAAARREAFILERRSFITETVFSHESKLELVRQALEAGFRVELYHVNVRTTEMSLARVAARVAIGGHNVPPDKIRARYERSKALIRAAAEIASQTMVFDNSRLGTPPRWLLTLNRGRLMEQTSEVVPAWAEELYLKE